MVESDILPATIVGSLFVAGIKLECNIDIFRTSAMRSSVTLDVLLNPLV
jgi:hypothetical protein